MLAAQRHSSANLLEALGMLQHVLTLSCCPWRRKTQALQLFLQMNKQKNKFDCLLCLKWWADWCLDLCSLKAVLNTDYFE